MTSRLPTAGYHAALLDYLQRNDESALTRAYEFGRSGFDAGFGPLQILHIHEDALRLILEVSSVDDGARRNLQASARFLLEALSPFEMVCRGYRAFLKIR